jgi:dTDP-4-amino-4,6-dideoxygalactose transaminase
MVHAALPPFGPGWTGEHVAYDPEQCPNTDRIVQSMVCVALTPGFSDADVDDIAAAVIKVWRGRPKEMDA